ncbi:cbb3-type cytochrome c oxidase subunit 3 [Gallaecimonas kandeliae]|uniref:cbb3-type cytochrome oxidase subunit 3 n=1 Tax=Gallaecimonas kandeliae TaxID=3029055 RepID=UPI0026472110|nr:cbb3-type cytochrome c oxidase subunit 3 [Gallaecimonas kandeliae]WKE67330.1 cbb3-type cytochrome c oxidase subunit 3 [Gallaecimonas kandeliae]
MDLQIIRGLITLLLLVIFIGIFLWAYSSRRKQAFDEAANLVFEDDTKAPPKEQESKQ